VKQTRRSFLIFALAAVVSASALKPITVLGIDRPTRFLAEERRIIEEYYYKSSKRKHKGLPPGLAKRGGNLPPGLQKQLDKNGRLPPGLQKRLEPLPGDLEARLPGLPPYWERVIFERDIILVDRRTERILDIIENVINLTQGR